jgi:hypothetical protein
MRGFEFITDSVPFLLFIYDIEDGIWQIRNFTHLVKQEAPNFVKFFELLKQTLIFYCLTLEMAQCQNPIQ